MFPDDFPTKVFPASLKLGDVVEVKPSGYSYKVTARVVKIGGRWYRPVMVESDYGYHWLSWNHACYLKKVAK